MVNKFFILNFSSRFIGLDDCCCCSWLCLIFFCAKFSAKESTERILRLTKFEFGENCALFIGLLKKCSFWCGLMRRGAGGEEEEDEEEEEEDEDDEVVANELVVDEMVEEVVEGDG